MIYPLLVQMNMAQVTLVGVVFIVKQEFMFKNQDISNIDFGCIMAAQDITDFIIEDMGKDILEFPELVILMGYSYYSFYLLFFL